MDDLIGSLGLKLAGTPNRLTYAKVRDLTAEDVVRAGEHKHSTPVSALKKLSHRHHALARAIAGGAKIKDAAVACGYTTANVQILLKDDKFIELIEYYQAQDADQRYDLKEKLYGLSEDAADEISDRLADSPEDFSIPMLAKIVELGADRSGLGPSSTTSVDVRVGLADRLQAARNRVASRRVPSDIIDVTPTELEGD